MNCPHCVNEPLVALEYERVEVDFCPECDGVWLDAGELELLFGDEKSARELLSIGSPAVVPPGEAPRDCPECDTQMTKESTSGAQPVTFDHCPQGHGLWLDAGELRAILSEGPASLGNTEIASYLKEIFGE